MLVMSESTERWTRVLYGKVGRREGNWKKEEGGRRRRKDKRMAFLNDIGAGGC